MLALRALASRSCFRWVGALVFVGRTSRRVPCFSLGRNIKLLLERPDGEYCFRLHRDRVFYLRSTLCIGFSALHAHRCSTGPIALRSGAEVADVSQRGANEESDERSPR